MRVGLYGIQGVYNFGCEAIVRGACTFVKDIYPDCEIVYFSFSKDYDKNILKDLNIEIVQVDVNKSLFYKVVNKVLKTLDIAKRISTIDVSKIISDVDIIVSIGGDIYTIPQVLRDKEKYPYYNSLVDFCEKVIQKNKKVIVYGASVGPWGNYKRAVDYNVKALSKYKVILCREEKSIEYLHLLGLKNVFFFPDPAFQVRIGRIKEKKYIGINLSPLSVKELYGSYDDVYVKKFADIMDKLYDEIGIELMFIPHVISQSEMDNDLWFMEKIRNYMRCRNHVKLADTNNGFIGVKEYLSQCYLVVAARMHCAINAIDENVPAVFLAYSQKSIGMCKYIYGNDKYLIDLKNIENELIDKTKDVLNNYELLSKKIATRNDEIKQYYKNNISKIREIITMR